LRLLTEPSRAPTNAVLIELATVRVLNVPNGARTLTAVSVLTLRLLTEPSRAPTNAVLIELATVRVLNVPNGARTLIAVSVLVLKLLTNPSNELNVLITKLFAKIVLAVNVLVLTRPL
jgi:hypothetical protein